MVARSLLTKPSRVSSAVVVRAVGVEATDVVAKAMEVDEVEQVAVQLAYHYEQAGILEKAVSYLLQAGVQAQKLSAQQEASQHLMRGLTLLVVLPDTPRRLRQELALQIALGHTLASLKGTAAVETGEAYNRAYVLAQQVGQTPQLFAALHGLHAYHNARGASQRAHALAEQLLRLAENQMDPVLRVSAHRALGITIFYLGEFASARQQLAQGIQFYHHGD
jgi:predicted ATPase